jgi:hypothetical protein
VQNDPYRRWRIAVFVVVATVAVLCFLGLVFSMLYPLVWLEHIESAPGGGP